MSYIRTICTIGKNKNWIKDWKKKLIEFSRRNKKHFFWITLWFNHIFEYSLFNTIHLVHYNLNYFVYKYTRQNHPCSILTIAIIYHYNNIHLKDFPDRLTNIIPLLNASVQRTSWPEHFYVPYLSKFPSKKPSSMIHSCDYFAGGNLVHERN